jgi:hypothetical protein
MIPGFFRHYDFSLWNGKTARNLEAQRPSFRKGTIPAYGELRMHRFDKKLPSIC